MLWKWVPHQLLFQEFSWYLKMQKSMLLHVRYSQCPYEWPQQQTPSLRGLGRQLNRSLSPELRTLYCLFSSSHTHPVLKDFNLRPQLPVPLCFLIQHRGLWTGEISHSFEGYNSLALILILIQVPTQFIIFVHVLYQRAHNEKWSVTPI